MSPRPGCYKFGPFLLDVNDTSLYRDGELVPLTPKVFDTLVALVLDSGRTLTKDELIERVWPDAAVGDGSLAQNILVLRKILDPHFPGEGPIATVPKRGYRFTAPVMVHTPAPPASAGNVTQEVVRQSNRPRPYLVAGVISLAVALLIAFLVFRNHPSAQPLSKRRSVAVLAFKNLTAKPESDWYSTALAETLTGELRLGGDLRVISSDNVRRMQQELSLPGVTITRSQINDIRNDLGCDLVLSGSYLTVGDQIRVELLLSDARTSDTLGSLTETDQQNHLLELVSRAGQQLRSKLGTHALQTAQNQSLQHAISANPRANRFYFDGLAALKVRDGPEAQRQLSLAIETDPGLALGHSALSATWHDLGYSARALTEAKTARDLADATQSREDRLSVEAQYYECLFDWKKAGETYRSLWQFFPDNMEYGLKLAQIEYAAGRPAEALKVLNQLRAQPPPDSLDPRIDLFESVGEQLSGHYQRAYESASQAAQKAERAKARILLAQARVKQGLNASRLDRPAEARRHYAEAKALFEAMGDTRDAADALALDAEVVRAMGQPEAAIAELETALEMSRKIGFTRLTNRILAAYANILLNLSSLDKGSLDKARKACDEAIASNSGINDIGTSYTILMDRAGIAKAQGRYADARADLAEGIRITKQAGYRLEAANAVTVLGVIDTGLGRLSDARRELEEAVARKRELGNGGSLAISLGSLAMVLRNQGDLVGAGLLAKEQCSILESAQKKSGLAGCRILLSRLLLDEGRTQEGRAAVVKLAADFALDSFAPSDLGSLAVLQFEIGDAVAAKTSVANAQRRWQKQGDIPDRSLPLALAAARISESVVQLQQVVGQAERLGLIPMALEARLALVQLRTPSGRRSEADQIAVQADQNGLSLIARKAKSL